MLRNLPSPALWPSLPLNCTWCRMRIVQALQRPHHRHRNQVSRVYQPWLMHHRRKALRRRVSDPRLHLVLVRSERPMKRLQRAHLQSDDETSISGGGSYIWGSHYINTNNIPYRVSWVQGLRPPLESCCYLRRSYFIVNLKSIIHTLCAFVWATMYRRMSSHLACTLGSKKLLAVCLLTLHGEGTWSRVLDPMTVVLLPVRFVGHWKPPPMVIICGHCGAHVHIDCSRCWFIRSFKDTFFQPED